MHTNMTSVSLPVRVELNNLMQKYKMFFRVLLNMIQKLYVNVQYRGKICSTMKIKKDMFISSGQHSDCHIITLFAISSPPAIQFSSGFQVYFFHK